MEWANFLYECLTTDKFSAAFVYRLLSYVKQCRDWHSGKGTHDLLYLSHLAYDVARNIKEEENEVKQKLIPLTDLNKSQLMAQLVFPITWALLKYRR